MKTRPKRNYSPEFRLEAAQLVVDQNYTVREAADAMSVGYSTMDKWVRQLRQERNSCANVGRTRHNRFYPVALA